MDRKEQDNMHFNRPTAQLVRALLGVEGYADESHLDRLESDGDFAQAVEEVAQELARDDEQVRAALESERELIGVLAELWQRSLAVRIGALDASLHAEARAKVTGTVKLSIGGRGIEVGRWLVDALRAARVNVDAWIDAPREAIARAWTELVTALKEDRDFRCPEPHYGVEWIEGLVLSEQERVPARRVRLKGQDLELEGSTLSGVVDAFEPALDGYGILMQVQHAGKGIDAGLAFGRLRKKSRNRGERGETYSGDFRLTLGIDVGSEVLPLEAKHLLALLVAPEIAAKIEKSLARGAAEADA